MIDLYKTLADLLGDICRVEVYYPDNNAVFPIITLCEIENKSVLFLDGTERLSNITFRISVWDNGVNRMTAEKISDIVSARMIRIGFHRDGASSSFENKLHCKNMTFSACVDNVNGKIYSK